jgi:hypothetical protein
MPRTKTTYRPVTPPHLASKVLIAKCMDKYKHDKVKMRANLAQLGCALPSGGRPGYFDPYVYHQQYLRHVGLTAEQYVSLPLSLK